MGTASGIRTHARRHGQGIGGLFLESTPIPPKPNATPSAHSLGKLEDFLSQINGWMTWSSSPNHNE